MHTRPLPRNVADCYSIDDLRRLAKHRLPRSVFDFFEGGAEDEHTLAANRQAFAQWRLAARVLTDVSQVSTEATLLGAVARMPMAIAPTGAAGFGRRGADLGLARAAAQNGIPYTLSSTATTAIETVAEAAPGRLWFQAYVLRDRDFFWKLVERARAANYEALVITVDLAVGGKRERDFHNHFSVPFRFTSRNVLGFAMRPRWALDMLFRGMPVIENLRGLAAAQTSSAIASSVGKNYDPSFDWARLAEVRDRWPRKLIVKGVSRGDDAGRLAAMGCDAIVVSNHGGRQLDGAVATLDALPEVLEGAGGRVPVLLDGGIRRGGDIAKALAIGAQGVLLGRATLFGAVAGGDDGALRALAILRDELIRTMQLCGARSIDQLTPDLLRPAANPVARAALGRSNGAWRSADAQRNAPAAARDGSAQGDSPQPASTQEAS